MKNIHLEKGMLHESDSDDDVCDFSDKNIDKNTPGY